MKFHYLPSQKETDTLGTDALRENFLISDLFKSGELVAHYTDLDRMIVGGVIPTEETIALPATKATGTDFFLERREIGIINVGQAGTIRVGGKAIEIGHLDCLYVGRGEKDVVFESGPDGGSAYYFISTPAHATCATALVRKSEVAGDPLGDAKQCNRRRIAKYIHPDGIKSCQLVMGLTEIEEGSIWNTMPPHTHSRRTEIYFYFDLGEDIVVHLMGRPDQTKHLMVHDKDAVLSPAWSIHAGAGTRNYRFIWAMGGDNQVFADMDSAPIQDLR